MKKSLLIMCALFCLCSTGQAQTATLMEGYGEPLTLDQFKALAGTSGRFGFVASSNSASATSPRCDHWCKFTSVHNTTTLDEDALFFLEASGDNYKVKRSSDGLYVNTSTSSTSFGEGGTAFKLVNRDPNDATKAVTGAQSISFEDPSNASMHYNANAVKYNNGAGAWTTYAVFGPIYIVEIDCREGGASLEGYPQTQFMVGGQEVTAPAYAGKKLVSGSTSSYTIAQDYTGSGKIVFSYESSSFNYSLVVNGAPSGTTMTIKGNAVSLTTTSVSYSDEVVASDIVVTFPAEYSYMGATVSISGTTITVNCEDMRWPVNFPKTQTFTRSDRHINSVTFDIEGEDQTVDGIYVNTSTLCYQDLTATKTVNLPTSTSVITRFNIAGAWQHGFVYIDLNNDGDFTDDGELVSKINEGNPGSSFALPAFTTPATAGSYRLRFKTDWSSEDPGGNTSPGNYIIDNGGMIVDVTLTTFTPSAHVTYIVKDEGGKTLFTSEPVVAALGDVITTLPAEYQKTDFYSYSTINVTISSSGNTDVVFSATPKDDAPVKYTADATSPVWYKMKLKDANYPTYVADGTDNVQMPTTYANNETAQWAFIGNPYAGFQIVNRAAGTGLVLGSATTVGISDSGASVHVSLAAPGTRARELWYITKSTYLTGGFFIYNADGHALNQRSTSYLAYWTNGADLGSTFTISEVQEGEELYNSLIAQLEAINWGTGLNQYGFTGEYSGYTSQAATIINGLKTQGYSDERLAVVQELLANYALNQPSAGFYRIKGKTSGKYLAAGLASNGKFAMSDAADASTIFYFDGSILTNFGSGMCNGMTSSAWAWVVGESASNVVFQDGLTNGGYAILSSDANFYDNGDNASSADRGKNVTINSSTNARYTSWYLEQVTTLPVAISDVKYATLYAPVALDIPADVTAYVVTDGETAVTLTEITDGVVPANVGVVLAGEAGTYNFAFSSETGSATSGLTGCIAAAARPEGSYILSDGTQGVGFYKDGPETVVGFKAYLPASGNSGQQVKAFQFDTPTAIDKMEGARWKAEDAIIYNLAGQRMNKAQKGIYIVNGKKVAIK